MPSRPQFPTPHAARSTAAHAIALMIAFGLGLGVTGCGPSGPRTYPVGGTVTFDGEPIADGYITFSPAVRGATPTAGPILAGRYDLRVTEGEKRVAIQASKFVGPENPIMGLRAREQYLPDRYNVETTLTATVTADGPNAFDFDLTSAPEGESAAP